MIEHKTTRGFTLTELVIVLILAAVLAAVAGPRFFNRSDFDERGFYDEVLAAARFAQKYAVTSGLDVKFSITGGNTYALTQSGASVLNPGSLKAFSNNAPTGVTLSPNTSLTFDAYGTVPTISTTTATITVGSKSFIVYGATGFVHEP